MPKEHKKSGAERVREYRKRLREDPEKYEEYLKKERERNKKWKEEGKVKSISDLSDREQRKVRRSWWKRQQHHRVLVKSQREMERLCTASTPPPTPSATPSAMSSPTPPHLPHTAGETVTPRTSSETNKRRSVMRVHRKIRTLELKIKELERKKEKYRKWCHRLCVRPEKSKCSPRTKTQKEVRKHRVPAHIRIYHIISAYHGSSIVNDLIYWL